MHRKLTIIVLATFVISIFVSTAFAEQLGIRFSKFKNKYKPEVDIYEGEYQCKGFVMAFCRDVNLVDIGSTLSNDYQLEHKDHYDEIGCCSYSEGNTSPDDIRRIMESDPDYYPIVQMRIKLGDSYTPHSGILSGITEDGIYLWDANWVVQNDPNSIKNLIKNHFMSYSNLSSYINHEGCGISVTAFDCSTW